MYAEHSKKETIMDIYELTQNNEENSDAIIVRESYI